MNRTTLLSRRTVLRRGATLGTFAVGGLSTADSVTADQGGVAYLKEEHLRGKNNPNEERFKIVEHCWTDEVALPCDGYGTRTYAAYKIRCPHFQGGGEGHTHDHTDEHHDGCGGGSGQHGCGRHILVNPNRNLRTGGVHEFTSVRQCGDEYVKAAFRPA